MNEPVARPSIAGVLIPGFEIDLRRAELRTRDGAHVDLRPRSFAVLRLLALDVGRLVTKDEIMERVWDGVVVTEDSLTQCIADIRRAIGDDKREVVRTIARRGYLLVGERLETALAPAYAVAGAIDRPPTSEVQKTRNLRPIAAAALAGLALLVGVGATSWPRARAAHGPVVAVLPFESLAGDKAHTAVADDLTEELIHALSRFRELRILARGTTASYRGGRDSPVAVGRAVKADYVVSGNIRGDADRPRVSIRLEEAGGGTQIWDRGFDHPSSGTNEPTFPRRVAAQAGAALAAWTGPIAGDVLKKSAGKPATALSPYECIAQGYAAALGLTADAPVRRARACLDMTLKRHPGDAGAWAAYTLVLTVQRWFGLGLEPPEASDLIARAHLGQQAVAAAQRAVEISPNEAASRFALSRAYYSVCSRDLMLVEAERAFAINPNDPAILGPLGVVLANAGFEKLGRKAAEKAIVLTAPTGPRYWWWAVARDELRRGNYALSLDAVHKSFAEQSWISHVQMAYTLALLGRIEEANAYVSALRRMRPGFTIATFDAYYAMWCFEPQDREKMRDALRRAGLPD